ncbi:MAG TPA: hypothetical protein VFY97_01480 [Rhodanobacteraceae bacterium]|nr:hypothetical protein [Rhodanobacteraceae bacterium]
MLQRNVVNMFWALARVAALLLAGAALLAISTRSASAMPEFARRYNLSCAACHSAFPRLNQFGEHFAANNMRLPNWMETSKQLGDTRLALPDHVPLAVRAQAYVQARDGKTIDPLTGATQYAATDFQAPYLVKVLSSAPLSENITYYFYAIFAEKGENGTVLVEDAWFSYANLFRTGIDMMLGQFQISDLMFPREVRLPFQDYMVYRMAGITYDRGVLFSRGAGPFNLDLGFTNGNGINGNLKINSPGYGRPDRMFDNDSSKTVFGRIGAELGPVHAGLFGASGKQRSATGPAGLLGGARDTDKRIFGLDASGQFSPNVYWYVQYLWNAWDGFLDADPARNYHWNGGFAGIDWIPNDRWAFSALYNRDNAGDLARTNTIYEGIAMNSLTLTSSYYFMRNVKGIIELNFDFLDKTRPVGPYFVGHLDKENYILVGFDTAF